MNERGRSEGTGSPNVTSFESTLPPTSKKEMLAADGATILVFSHDAGLATVIKNVAGNRYPIRVIDQWRDLLQLVGSGSGRIVLVDVDALNQSVDESLADLNRCADWLVTVIAAKQQQAQDFMRFWSERRIHRLLIKPAAVGITRLLLESAVARYMELRELHENTDAMEIPVALLEQVEAETRNRWIKPVLVSAAVLAVGAVGYAMLGGDTEEAPVSANSGVRFEAREVPVDRPTGEATIARQTPDAAVLDVPADVEPDPFAELVRRAQEAQSAGRIVTPLGDNALDHYAAVLDRAPEHAVARAGLDALLEDLFLQAEASLLAGDLEAVETTLSHLRRGAPNSSRLHFLSEQFAQTRVRGAESADLGRAVSGVSTLADAAPAQIRDEPLGEVQSMLTLARLRISQAALIAPKGDSAWDYLLRAADIDAGNQDLASLRAGFAAEAARAAPAAFARGDFDQASELLEAALALGPPSVELETLRADIVAARAATVASSLRELHARAIGQIEARRLYGEPDSALEILSRMREMDAEHALADEVESRLRAALVTSAQQAIEAERFDRAREMASVLEESLLDRQASANLNRAIEHGERQMQFLTETSPIGLLQVRNAEAPVYPRDALNGDVEGWVDLNFTVDETGMTRDIVVVAAEPPTRFEDAAIEAVSRYEFEPFEFEGQRYARRIRARIRFELN